MYLHDIIKIKYADEGYLLNYPPHLISDEEMIDAFINNDINYFNSNYILLNESLIDEYEILKSSIRYHLNCYLNSDESERYVIPNWVYSYMIGSVLNLDSNQQSRHLLLVGLNCDNMDDEFTAESQARCYNMSKIYVNKLSRTERELMQDDEIIYLRPPTMFGEPHVLKMIRLIGVG